MKAVKDGIMEEQDRDDEQVCLSLVKVGIWLYGYDSKEDTAVLNTITPSFSFPVQLAVYPSGHTGSRLRRHTKPSGLSAPFTVPCWQIGYDAEGLLHQWLAYCDFIHQPCLLSRL